jgi:hypothetical protein
MTFTQLKSKIPLSKPVVSNETTLLVNGQGTLLFTATAPATEATVVFSTAQHSEGAAQHNEDSEGNPDTLKITLSDGKVQVKRNVTEYIDPKNNSGLVNSQGAYYWVSLDSQNQTIRVGTGEARVETIIWEFTFLFTDNEQRKVNKLFMESLATVTASASVKPIKLLRDPVTSKLPVIIKPTEELSMDHVAKATYLPKANLPQKAQQLYDCIAGKQFTLDTPDFPDFSKAIEYSIKTPGLWCHERLKEKSTEFDKDKPNYLETYLRITLGQNNGESPGIPYVMEIWPPGHYSPVHNHGSADAIIRVLHGTINVSLFPYLSTDPQVKPFAVVDFNKDDITWISPTLNQVHQLLNKPKNLNTCITIQCYMYDQKDNSHYDYFDYIDANNKRQQYEPDSDMDFVKFKELMWKEYKTAACCCF